MAATGRSVYSGSAECRYCHAAQYVAWAKSPHALALRPATTRALGLAAADARLAWGGDASASVRTTGGAIAVVVDEPEVDPGPYELPYVFGGRFVAL